MKKKRIKYRRAKGVECRPIGMSRHAFRMERRKFKRQYKKKIKAEMAALVKTLQASDEAFARAGYAFRKLGQVFAYKAPPISLPPLHHTIQNTSILQLTQPGIFPKGQ